jgi:acetylornithine deacetylase
MIEVMSAENAARVADLLEQLVAIPSVTGEEAALLDFVAARCAPPGWRARWTDVSPGRRNLYLSGGPASVVFMTHADTVPSFVAPARRDGLLFGRGSCDAKASLAAMLVAIEALAPEKAPVGLLVLVGEEKGSDGALAANRDPQGAQYIVGGEPTGNRFVAGTKGALRLAVSASGEAGHSSQPRSGRSAVPPLLDFLEALRHLTWPVDPVFGETTANIGVLQAGTAANVMAESARAEILLRTGIPIDDVLARLREAARDRVDLAVGYRSEPVLFRCPAGRRGEVVAFACDLPLLPAWGEPLLVGPGSILDAHTAGEKVSLAEVSEAVELYLGLARGLLEKGEAFLEPREAFIGRSRAGR